MLISNLNTRTPGPPQAPSEGLGSQGPPYAPSGSVSEGRTHAHIFSTSKRRFQLVVGTALLKTRARRDSDAATMASRWTRNYQGTRVIN